MSEKVASAPKRKRSLREKLVIGTVALAFLASVGDAVLSAESDKGKSDKEKAAEAIATQMYKDPRIQKVKNYESQDGYDGVGLRFRLPKDPTAERYMKKYEADDSEVKWLMPTRVYTLPVHKDGEFATVETPPSDVSLWEDDVHMTGPTTGTAVLRPAVTRLAKEGTERAVYVSNTAFATHSPTVTGSQFVGVIRLAEHTENQNQWVVVPHAERNFADTVQQGRPFAEAD